MTPRRPLACAALLLAIGSALPVAATQGQEQEETMSELEYLKGRLSYRKKSTGVERGREDWWLTVNRDGTRTLRTVAMTDDSLFVRDALVTLGTDERTQDAFVRLQVGDQLVGTGYFKVEGDRLMVVADNPGRGRSEQTLPVPTDHFHVTTHAVMLDGWIPWSYDRSRDGEQTITMYNTSTRWNGTDGPLGNLEPLRVEYLGEEEVTVPAGTFPCRHYRFDSDVVDVPTSNIWVTGEHNLLVRYDWPELDLEYVLVSLVVEESPERE